LFLDAPEKLLNLKLSRSNQLAIKCALLKSLSSVRLSVPYCITVRELTKRAKFDLILIGYYPLRKCYMCLISIWTVSWRSPESMAGIFDSKPGSSPNGIFACFCNWIFPKLGFLCSKLWKTRFASVLDKFVPN
jgi:hypothetical protein